MRQRIAGGRVLIGGALTEADITIEDGWIASIGDSSGPVTIDARGKLVLPGIIDVHGDTLERQIMPRPGVAFDLAIALIDTDRQLIANGITTAYHGVTWSWEPGLRSGANALGLMHAVRELGYELHCDTRVHLRHEIFNVAEEDGVIAAIEDGLVDLVAFNDHMEGIALTVGQKKSKRAKMIERSGLGEAQFAELVALTYARKDEIPESLAHISGAASAQRLPLISHDDRNESDRRHYRALGCTISEFPMTENAAREAAAMGEMTVMGAPNVLRGGSHTGCVSATEMVRLGLCSILASDYYYPALFHAPFVLARAGIAPLEQAWALVSSNPAAALGLSDRGTIMTGNRADIVIADIEGDRPRLMTTFASNDAVIAGALH